MAYSTAYRETPLPETYIDRVSLSQIRLDPENPRLPPNLDDRSPGSLLEHFARRYNIIELARSISDKGFTPRHAEALLVIEDPPGSGIYMTVEGNRRLAALILLEDESERRRLGLGAEWNSLAKAARPHNLGEAPVIVYPSRADLDDYLGFRHITGPTPWRPQAKARFIAHLLQDGESVQQVARRIGSNARTVRRLKEAHAAYAQAVGWGIDVALVEGGFGVFYNALDWEGVREFLGLASQRSDLFEREPVPPDRREHLEQLVALLFGNDERALKRVIHESRDLRKLSDVLKDEITTTILIKDRDLDAAWRSSGGGLTEVLATLRDLRRHLAEINGQAREFRDEPTVREQVERLYSLALDTAERYGVVAPPTEPGE